MTTPPYQPLTARSLQEFADHEKQVSDGLAEDCQAIEDILVRLAGPTLQGIEEDTAILTELQQRLAAPALEGIKRDMQRITKIMRKLFTPIDNEISKDTTLLTGIASRAQGSAFPSQRRSATNPGLRGNPGEVGTRQPRPSIGPTSAPSSAGRVGLPGVPSTSSPGGGAGYPTSGSASQPTIYPISAQSASGGIGGQALPIQDIDPETGSYVPSSPSLPPMRAGVSPFQAPSPSSTLPEEEEEPDLTVVSGATGGGVVTLGGSGREPPPLPEPPPPLPAPPETPLDPLSALLRCCEALTAQVAAVAQALYQMRPDVRSATAGAGIAPDDDTPRPPLVWTDPPDQPLTTPDLDQPDTVEQGALAHIISLLNGRG